MKKGFTLAEVLITLGIIGVVAVLTVPSVMHDYKNKLYTTQLKKVYTDISNAIENVKDSEHLDEFTDTKAASKTSDITQGAQYFLEKYFTHVKGRSCNEDGKNCQNRLTESNIKYESINGEEIKDGLLGQYCIQTKYGAIICYIYNHTNSVATLMVDVNGTAEPNVTGRDAFVLDIKGNSLEDMVDDASQCNKKTEDYTHIASYASGCLQSIIENNWTMKY